MNLQKILVFFAAVTASFVLLLILAYQDWNYSQREQSFEKKIVEDMQFNDQGVVYSHKEELELIIADLKKIEECFTDKRIVRLAKKFKREAKQLQARLEKNSANIDAGIREFRLRYDLFVEECNQRFIQELEKKKKIRRQNLQEAVTTASYFFEQCEISTLG